ncbi:plasmid segregation centromere-binding protein ParR [Schaedlerella sp.]|uniref:plasmid segregation centromere-binding protein ParR n=1 Tax=Schaedlerella sp. TaxID=2676057 RepID=UPI0037462FA1
MSRPVFSFRPNMEYPEHQKAWEILKNVPEGQKSLFLVQAILQKDQAQSLEKMIRKAVREELDGVRLEKATVSAGTEGGEQEIPGRMLDFLLQIE